MNDYTKTQSGRALQESEGVAAKENADKVLEEVKAQQPKDAPRLGPADTNLTDTDGTDESGTDY